VTRTEERMQEGGGVGSRGEVTVGEIKSPQENKRCGNAPKKL